jgi:hypothetical protein
VVEVIFTVRVSVGADHAGTSSGVLTCSPVGG